MTLAIVVVEDEVVEDEVVEDEVVEDEVVEDEVVEDEVVEDEVVEDEVVPPGPVQTCERLYRVLPPTTTASDETSFHPGPFGIDVTVLVVWVDPAGPEA